ncbi:hypothetical protein INR49_018318 [Caranx melampygus]|nr:hypothetical protein INR49_018318 [Caranx melampygus]
MKTLVQVSVLLVLAWGLTEGLNVTKCGLRDQLINATKCLNGPNGTSQLGLIAKIVCQADKASGFNHSAVNELIFGLVNENAGQGGCGGGGGGVGKGGKGKGRGRGRGRGSGSGRGRGSGRGGGRGRGRGKRAAPDQWLTYPPIRPNPPTKSMPPTGPNPPIRPTRPIRPNPPTRPTRPNEVTLKMMDMKRPRRAVPMDRGGWGSKPSPPTTDPKLYGLFQLSDQLACSSNSSAPSPNVCGLNCTSLIDDDISDDISCMLHILTNFIDKALGACHWGPLKKAMKGSSGTSAGTSTPPPTSLIALNLNLKLSGRHCE